MKIDVFSRIMPEQEPVLDVLPKFHYMEEVVKDICHSMEHDPDRWSIGTNTIKDLKTDASYWNSINEGMITEVWSGRTTEQVFSHAQGKRIRESFRILRQTKASMAQERLLNSVKPAGPSVFQKFCTWLRSKA